jgi:heptosyltransferase III
MRRLAIRPGAIGDTILGFPALEHLAVGAELEVWARSEVLGLIGFASRVEAISRTGIETVGVPGLALREGLAERLAGFDEIVSWYGENRAEFGEALRGLHGNVRLLRALPGEQDFHATDFFASQVGAELPAVARVAVEPRRNRLVWIHPFSGSARKNWALERYLQLGRWLEASGRAVQFVVSPEQNLAGAKKFGDLRELGEWLAGGAMYVGNDSGITHLAAACGARVVAIFGPTDERQWGPRGECVRVLKAADLDALHVDQVLDAVLAGMSEGASSAAGG